MVKIRHYVLLISMAVIGIVGYIGVNNTEKIANSIIQDLEKANINIGDISLNGLTISIDNVYINDLENNKVAKADNIKFKINPLLPSRFYNISITGVDAVIKRYKNNKFNFENIFPRLKQKKKRQNYIQNVKYIKIEDANVKYIDYSYKKVIEKDLENVNSQILFYSDNEAKIYAKGNLLTPSIKEKQIAQIKVDTRNKVVDFKFDNVHVDEFLSQYMEFDDAVIKKGILNGKLKIKFKDDDINLYGKLLVDAKTLYYTDYDDIFIDVKGSAKFNGKDINVSANTLVNQSPVNVDVDINIEKGVAVKINTTNVHYTDAKKYSLVKALGIDLDGDIDVNADMYIDIEGKLSTLDIDVLSNELSLFNQKFEKPKIKILKKADDNNINIDINSKVKSLVNFDLNSNIDISLDDNSGKGVLNLEFDKNNKIKSDILINSFEDIKLILNEGIASGNIEYKNKNLDVDANLDTEKIKLSIKGNTDSKLAHKYKISTKTKNIDFDVDLKGISSDIQADLNINEIWLSYQRFKDISAKLKYKDNLVEIGDIKNKNLSGYAKYNTNSNDIDLDLNLSKYILYNRADKIDFNLNIDKLKLTLNGKLNNLKGNINLKPSLLNINGTNIGSFNFDGSIDNNIIKYVGNVNQTNIDGTFDIIRKYIDFDLNINQDLSSIINSKDLDIRLRSKIKVNGTKDNINAKLDLILDNIKYRQYEMPKFLINAKYSNGNLSNLLKTGIVDISNIDILSNEDKKIYSSKDIKFDLTNLNIRYHLNKELDMSDINKDFGGILKINTSFIGDLEKYYGEINLESALINTKNITIENLLLNSKFNQNGITIDQGYLEYEKNPILLTGFVDYGTSNYELRMFSDNFNIDFLKLNKKIKEAKGIANIDFYANNNTVEGRITLDNVKLVTDDFDIAKFNVDILMKNREININDFHGKLNGGNIFVDGQIEIPEIPDDFIKSKKINLGKSDVVLRTENVEIPIYGNKIVSNIDLKLESSQIYGSININGGLIENIDFLDKKKKNETTEISKKINEYMNSILKQYSANVYINIDKPLDVNIIDYLIIKNIEAKLYGGVNLLYNSGNISIIGDIYTKSGNFSINSKEFVLDTLNVKFSDPYIIDPYIVLKAVTKVNEEQINVHMNSKLSELNIEFSSSSNLDTDQILKLLAFNRDGNINFGSIKSVGNNLVGIATETAINKYINSFTNKFGKKIGLTKLEVNADINNSGDFDFNKFFDNTAIRVDMQGKVLKSEKLSWNVETVIPVKGKNLKYNVNLSYNIHDNLKGNVGMKSSNNISEGISYYGGINYSSRFNTIDEILKKHNLSKREKLEKEGD